MKPLADPYASGVLKPSVHGQLVAGIKTYAANANITPERIWTSLYDTDASQDESQYIKAFRRQAMNENYGLVFVGKDPTRNVVDAMANLAGAMVRNFCRARIMCVAEVFDIMEERGFPEHTCLLIPDFHLESSIKQPAPKGWASKLTSLLFDRQTRGLQTVLYVSDMSDLKLEYGRAISRLIETSYQIVEVD